MIRTSRIFVLLLLAVSLSFAAQNGIDVGRAKVYDNRSLTLMLDTLNDQLKQVQVVNQSTLSTALGMLQGYQTQEVIRAGSVQAAVPYSAPATASDPTPAPKVPALAGVPWDMNTGFTNLTPSSENKYGLNAGDLLSDQVNLTYQIFNVRLLLDRSLSDRLHEHQPKLQAVLGFNVTLDPPRDAVGSAAIVEVTIKRKSSNRGVSVVALLPQERTYNSAALSTKSNAFGGSAAAKLITIGYSERRRGQTYYLFRDNDTISFERMKKYDEPVTFGWQFRPVLGRSSVVPGARQMFAVVALDETDLQNETEAAGQLEVVVTTHWRKYDRGSLTTAERNQIPWWDKAGYVLGLGVPFVYPPDGSGQSSYDLSVPKTSAYQKDLAPEVTDVNWTWVGRKEMLVSVAGKNFFKETKVVVGGKVLDAPPALTIKSDQAFDLLIDANGPTDAAILGRYGAAITLQEKSVNWKLVIEDVHTNSPVGGFRWVDIILAKDCVMEGCCKELFLSDLPAGGADARLAKLRAVPASAMAAPPLIPVISLNGTLLPGPWSLTEFTSADESKRVLARALISIDAMKEPDGLLTLNFPFKGPQLAASFHLNNPLKIVEVLRLHKGDKEDKSVQLLLTASAGLFREGEVFGTWRAVLSDGSTLDFKACEPTKESFCHQSGDIAILRTEKLMNGEKLILENRTKRGISVYPIAVPKAKDEKPVEKAPTTVNQFDSVWVPLDVEGFKDFDTADIDGHTLNGEKELIKESKDGKITKVEVYLSRVITSKPGTIEVTFRNLKNVPVNRSRIVVNCVECQSREAKKP